MVWHGAHFDHERGAGVIVSDAVASMVALHAALMELFELHQMALIERDVALARGELATFAAALRAHAHAEHEHFLGTYATFESERRDAAQVFELEHARIDQLLVRVELDWSSLPGDALSARAVLRVLEREASFKHLLEHHFLREERVLVPRFEREFGVDVARARVELVRAATFAR